MNGDQPATNRRS